MEAYSQQLGGSLEGLLPPDCGLRYMLSGLSQVKAFCSPFPCLKKWLHLQKKKPLILTPTTLYINIYMYALDNLLKYSEDIKAH